MRTATLTMATLLAFGCGSSFKVEYDTSTDGPIDSAVDTVEDSIADTGQDAPDGACVDGDPCSDGDPCTFPDTCEDGACRPGPDICGCTSSEDCDDTNACTIDTCTSGTCLYDPVICDDTNPCTNDSCDPGEGCVQGPNEAPCEDGDPCTGPDSCYLGSCHSGPMLPTWHADSDYDGWGSDLGTICAEMPPPGYSAIGGDCCDSEPDVNPGQTWHFSWPYTCGSGMPPSFDYDCDGIETHRWNDVGSCWVDSWGRCRTTPGWADYSWVPYCGESAYWIDSCAWYYGYCYESSGTDRIQECR